MRKAALIAVALTAVTSAQANTGNELLQKLKDPSPVEGMAYVQGVMVGLAYGMTAATTMLRPQASERTVDAVIGFCIPERVTFGQLADTTRLYLEAHPEVRHQTAPPLIRAALMQAYPCKR